MQRHRQCVLRDLTHIAVEAVLQAQSGFFGLVAQGWDIEDTTGDRARGPLPREALEVEQLVALFLAERSSGAQWTPGDFSSVRPLTGEQLDAVRWMVDDLLAEWAAVPVGGAFVMQRPGPRKA